MTSANNQSFGYSAANRLTSATGAYGAQSWVFDGVGNRTSQTIAGATSTYTYPATNNKLQSISGATARSFTYDGAGNIATDELHAAGATLRERPGAGADMNRSDFNLAAGIARLQALELAELRETWQRAKFEIYTQNQ